MDRAEIERLLDDTVDLTDVAAADRQRMVENLMEREQRRRDGVIDFNEERAIRMEMEFLRRVDREYPGWTDLRWNGERWIVTVPSS
jgi:hypothetical protein